MSYYSDMFTRNTRLVDDPSLPPKVRIARKTLAARGWSYRSAAPLMGVTYQHLAMVLTGRRESRRLLAAIHALPSRKEAAR